MRYLTPVLCVALVSSAWAAEPTAPLLFNGKDLTGWTGTDTAQFWRVEGDILVGESNADLKGNYLWTEKSYGDFILEFDVRWNGEIDSGVDFRKPNLQLQLGVSRSLKRDMTGSFYITKQGYPDSGQAKTAAQQLRAAGQWNTFRLIARGNTFTLWINGQRAANYTDANFAGAAPLGLQIHVGVKMKVEYRNIRLTELQ